MFFSAAAPRFFSAPFLAPRLLVPAEIPQTGDGGHLFDHRVQQLCLLGLSCPVIDLLALAAADDEPAVLKLTQMVRNRRAAHAHHGGDVDYTFFAVAQKPEDLDAPSVAQLLENLRDRLKLLFS